MDLGGQLKGHVVSEPRGRELTKRPWLLGRPNSLQLLTFGWILCSSLRLAAVRREVWGKWAFPEISNALRNADFCSIKYPTCFDVLVEKTGDPIKLN